MRITRGILIAVTAIAIATLAFAVERWLSAKASAQDAAENLVRCRMLATEIAELKRRPTQASLQLQSQQELASLVAASAKVAEIADSAVVSIRPEPARRVAKTAYLQQSTGVQLRQVSLRQLVNFLAEVTTRDRRILPSSLRLSAPRGKNDGQAENWQVEVVLTNLVFSPESGGS
jgi:hypothetical protein